MSDHVLVLVDIYVIPFPRLSGREDLNSRRRIFCPTAISSWSMGLNLHFNQILREIQQISPRNAQKWPRPKNHREINAIASWSVGLNLHLIRSWEILRRGLWTLSSPEVKSTMPIESEEKSIIDRCWNRRDKITWPMFHRSRIVKPSFTGADHLYVQWNQCWVKPKTSPPPNIYFRMVALISPQFYTDIAGHCPVDTGQYVNRIFYHWTSVNI